MRKELSFHNHEEKVFLGILHKCKRTARTTMNKIRENKVITIFLLMTSITIYNVWYKDILLT